MRKSVYVNNKIAKIWIGTSYDIKTQQCILTFEDNGIGMDKDTLSNFQNPFFTTKSTGTGMGSAIANAIIKLHGGTMTTESEYGKGTKFTIALPLVSNLSNNKQDLYDEIAQLDF